MLFPFSLTYILSLYSEQLSEMGIIILFYGGESCVLVKYWAGQKVCSGFSIRWYELSGQLNNMSKTAQFLSSGDTIFNHFHLTPKLLFSLAILKVCQRLQHLYSKLCFSQLTHAPGSSTKILFSDHTSWALVWKTRSKTSSLAKRLSRYSFLTLLHQWLSPGGRMVGSLGWPWPSLPMSQANCSPFWVKREENHREEKQLLL